MKQGRSLSELAATIERQNAAKKDYIAPAKRLSFEVDEASNELVLSGLNGGYLPNDHFHSQIGTKLSIPKAYYDRMRQSDQGLLAVNVNHWLRHSDAKHLVRTLDGKTARAFLSDRYRPLDNYDLANAVLPVLADAQIRVESCEVTETRMYIKAVSPRTEMEVKKGDVVQAGIVIGNSEVGNGTLNISPMIYRLVCSNGMISADHSMRKYHTGARNDADNGSWELFSDKTRQLSDAAVWNQVRDLVKGALSDVGFAKIVDGLKVAAGRVIDANPVEIVEVVQRNFSLSDEDKGGILKHLTTGADLSLWGVTNAVTRYSQDVADYTKATELEAIGGQILELSPTQWEKISA